MEELGVVEREIDRLEKKVEELKLNLYKEREQNKEWEIQQRLTRLWQHNLLLNNGPEINNRSVLNGQRSRSQHFDELRKDIMLTERRFSSSAASDIQISMSSTGNQFSAFKKACDFIKEISFVIFPTSHFQGLIITQVNLTM